MHSRLRPLGALLLIATMLPAAMPQSRQTLHVMTWNVENLFDTVHDEGCRDDEFLPDGERRWMSQRYWRKISDVATVIASAAGEGALPDIVGLCEVENDSVLTTLVRRSELRNLGYEYVMTHSSDERGIDVALLYQPMRFRLLEQHDVRVPSRENGLRPTRDILLVKGLVHAAAGFDTLNVIVAHLPSRAGGHEGDKNRRLAARTLWSVVDSLLTAHAEASIILMGDFNASHRDRIFRRAPLRLTDDPHSGGTYCFRGFWEWLDHILVSPHLQADAPARPLRLPWLLEENRTYGGDMPRRTFRGPVYHGGISDHLPVLLDVIVP